MNMKALLKVLLLFYVVFLVEGCIYAQFPKPHWVKNTIQAPKEGQYIFVYGEGDGSTPDEAYKKAFANAWIKGQWELEHIDMPSQSIKDVEQNGIEAATRYTKYAIKETCRTDALLYYDVNGICYKSYVLLQMAKSLNPDFYCLPNHWENFDAEYTREVKKYNNRQKSTEIHDNHKVDRTALAWSILPGGGQFYKNHPGLAWTIIGSEALLIGGGVACYFIGQNQQDIMNNHNTNYNDYQAAESTYNTVTSLQPWLYGAAAAVYVANLVTAYFINDNRENKSLTFTPKIIPINSDLALGVGFSYKF